MSDTAGPPLTVTLIARDEEDRLPEALAAVAFAEEIVVVVDSATTDRTAEIAEAAGAHVLVRDVRRLRDAEERRRRARDAPLDPLDRRRRGRLARPRARDPLPPRGDGLGEEPRRPRSGSRSGSSSSGASSTSGATRSCRPARLYDRTRARFSEDPVHEKVVASGPVEALDESILHRSYRDLAHYLEKLDRYTTLAAEAKWAARKGAMPFLPIRVAWEFFDRAILRLGILDGTAGLTFAALSSANTLLKYLKLRELEDAIARGERLPPANARAEDTAVLRIRALMRFRR